MIVVADSSPLIVLINIGHIEVLPRLFTQVFLPTAIWRELQDTKRPQAVRDYLASPPVWLIEKNPKFVEPVPLLHPGERAAIALARELAADLLLIDETRGRRAAVDRNIPITGTIGVLELAAQEGLIDLADAFERVKRTDFWISRRLLDERLKLHRKKK